MNELKTNHVRSWEEVREMLEREIQVYYVKNEETNRKRERDKEKYIQWIIDEMKGGIDLEHTLRSLPEFAWTFGDEWQYIQKAMRMRYPNCAMCGRPTQEIHHIRPRFLKGQNIPSNLIPLCLECHDEVHRRLTANINKAIVDSIGEDVAKTVVNKSNMLDKWVEQ